MCDDHTHADDLAAGRLNRRAFAGLLAAVPFGAFAMSAAAAPTPPADSLKQGMVRFAGGDGEAQGYFVHPPRGRHPGVIIWPDIGGVRDAYMVMARRLAAAGHAVLVVNQYYRGARAPVFDGYGTWRTPEGEARLRPLLDALTPTNIARDGVALLAWLDAQPAVSTERGVGVAGYCQGGQFAVRTAAAAPSRVAAIAAFHAGNIVSDKADSAHLLLGTLRSRLVVGVARNDFGRDPGNTVTLREAVIGAGLAAEIEVYDADHGWCVLDHPAYAETEAERAWAKMTALFAGL